MSLDPVEPGRRRSDVIRHLSRCKTFYFAGHGFTDNNDPSQSYLLFDDGKENPLTVAGLLQMNVREQMPFLAYLSACRTGQNNNDELQDESLYLISAFRLVGFRHVIGTLWEVNDKLCVQVAKIVYEGMSLGLLTDESVCLGLHNASRKLREDWLSNRDDSHMSTEPASHGHDRKDSLLREGELCGIEEGASPLWVPYVHMVFRPCQQHPKTKGLEIVEGASGGHVKSIMPGSGIVVRTGTDKTSCSRSFAIFL